MDQALSACIFNISNPLQTFAPFSLPIIKNLVSSGLYIKSKRRCDFVIAS